MGLMKRMVNTMKRKYRLFSVLLAAALVLAAAGCAAGSGPAAPSDAGGGASEIGAPPAPEVDAVSPDAEEPSVSQPEEEKPDAQQPANPAKQEIGGAAEGQSSEEEKKETAYQSGTTLLKADDGFYFYELQFVDGELVSCWLESDEGKGGWGGDSPNGIEKCRFYGMTVEEASERLESENCTVTIG